MARTPDPSGRDRILAVASQLFYRHGVRAVGTAQVIAEAGCGKSMLYRHFPGKADLVTAYLSEARTRRDVAAAQVLANASDDPRERLVEVVAEVAAWVRREDFRGCAFRKYLIEFPDGAEAPADVARAYLADTRRQIDELVAAAGARPQLADRIWLLVDGLYGRTGTNPQVAVEWARELVRAS